MGTVIFKIMGGEVTPEIEMPVSATIPELKRRIETLLDVGVGRQTLKFENRVLMNDQTISHYNFKPFAQLFLGVEPLAGRPKFKIWVKSNYDESIHVRVKETTSVAKLKKKIEDIWIFPCKYMTLFRLSVEMDDDLPLSAYYIPEGSKVEVLYRPGGV